MTENPPRAERTASPPRRLARRQPEEARTRPSWLRWWILALVLVGIAGRAVVYLLPFDVPSTDYGSLEAAHYQTSRVGMFTIFHRGALSGGVGGPAPIPSG